MHVDRPPRVHWITCRQCGIKKQVRDAVLGRVQRYCSRKCGGQQSPIRKATKAQLSAWGKKGALKTRERTIARLGGEEQRAAWKKGYHAGWWAGVRYMQRWGDVRTGAPNGTSL